MNKAKEMESIGAKIITLKDMAGLVNPLRAASIISALKKNLSVPVDFHTHCTPGYGLASSLMAILNGVDILDTNIWYFGGGSAAPAIELIYIFCKKLGVEVECDMKVVGEIREQLVDIRRNLAAFDLQKDHFPATSIRLQTVCLQRLMLCSIRRLLQPRLLMKHICWISVIRLRNISVSRNLTNWCEG